MGLSVGTTSVGYTPARRKETKTWTKFQKCKAIYTDTYICNIRKHMVKSKITHPNNNNKRKTTKLVWKTNSFCSRNLHHDCFFFIIIYLFVRTYYSYSYMNEYITFTYISNLFTFNAKKASIKLNASLNFIVEIKMQSALLAS